MFQYYLLMGVVILMGGFLFGLMFYSFYIVLTSKSNYDENEEMATEESTLPGAGEGAQPADKQKSTGQHKPPVIHELPTDTTGSNSPPSRRPRRKAA